MKEVIELLKDNNVEHIVIDDTAISTDGTLKAVDLEILAGFRGLTYVSGDNPTVAGVLIHGT